MMNVIEFAEQVVFGTTLEDKLLIPGRLTLDLGQVVGPSVSRIVTPGRPPGLQMRDDRSGGMKPPSDDKLENEQARGQLLHFLANHELLATELMALVLLKFPNAPHAFRQGILVTLQEEQEHTRMYIRRMKECGIEFGSYPVSGQIWRMIESMQSPMDFVSRLSLTFEQANLDYSHHFATVFRRIGDMPTAEVMQQIYEDEIGHVKHGLHWFRQWKDPEQSDWEAYQSTLEFPMSPQRGLGLRAGFNRQGRKQAGLSDDFIDSIEVFRQSRGRAPTIRWFDPAAESELAGQHSPNELPLMDQLGRDLELVMVAMSKQDDVVLVRKTPSRSFRLKLIDAGFDLPQFLRFEDRASLNVRKLHDFSPWAWTPKNHEIAQPLIESTRHLPVPWKNETTDLYRKSWGALRLKDWLDDGVQDDGVREDDPMECPDWFTSPDCVGIAIQSIEEMDFALAEFGRRGFASAIFKQDLAASGRGQRRLACGQPMTAADEAWLLSKLGTSLDVRSEEGQRPPMGIIEPELNRLVDLSFLWHMPRHGRSPRYLGWTRPLISAGRRYCGTRLGTSFTDCDSRVKRFVLADRCARLQTVVDWLQPRIAAELTARGFTGYFGVDSIVCQDSDENLKIKPLVELNPRMTMGHIALRLKKRLASGTEAMLCVLNRDEWDRCHAELAKLPLGKLRDGRWTSGVVWLGEVDEQTKLIPAVLIGEEAMTLSGRTNGPF